jgi:WD40 repeat protein
VLSVALTPDGKWVLSGSKDRGVQFWDPHTAQTQLMLQGHKNSGKFLMSYASNTIPERLVVLLKARFQYWKPSPILKYIMFNFIMVLNYPWQRSDG